MYVGQSMRLTKSTQCCISKPGVLNRILRTAALAVVVTLAGCAGNSTTPAPVNNLSDASASNTNSNASAGTSYVVKTGDSLRKISNVTGVDESTLIKLNGITDPNRLRVGQVLRLSERNDNKLGVSPITQTTKPVARPLDQNAADTPPSRAPDAGVISWAWPANGKLIQGFTAVTKGIDIGGNLGDPVVAAANGKVVYAGNGIRGLGNLVIVDHGNGFITAYAHNKSLLVKTGQEVKQGARIAELGQTDATSPRLHFEVRRQNTPVDPLQYLPVK